MLKPDTMLARRGQLVSWLGSYGIPKAEVDALIREGVLERKQLRANGRGFYLVSEVEEKILAPLLARNGRQKSC